MEVKLKTLLFGHQQQAETTSCLTHEFLRKKKQPWPWVNLVWFKNRIHSHSFIAWLALRNRLKTLSRLKKWGIVQLDLCVHCWREEEMEEHLLYDCVLAKRVWKKLKQTMGYGGNVAAVMEKELALINALQPAEKI